MVSEQFIAIRGLLDERLPEITSGRRSGLAGEIIALIGVPPGPCFHDPGVTWPNGDRPRCELRAGHAGAHECDRGSLGGTAIWTDEEADHG